MVNNNGKYTLDFSITDEEKFLVLRNLSQYPTLPERPQYVIKAPGYANGSFVPADPYNVTEVSSAMLGMTKPTSDLTLLPDGIYQIAFEICPYDQFCVVKHHFRDYTLQKDLGKRITDLILCDDDLTNDKILNQLMEIDILITGVKAAVEENKLTLAAHFLSKLQDVIKVQNQLC